MSRKTGMISWAWFLIHALVEFVSFTVLYRYFRDPLIAWTASFAYDLFAFVPQGLYGALHKRKPFDLGTVGAVLLLAGAAGHRIGLAALILTATGNALLHEAGAIATTMYSEGRFTPSALFVAGGSFGLVFGQVIGAGAVHAVLWCVLACILIELMVLYSNTAMKQVEWEIPKFRVLKEDVGFYEGLMIALFVVIVRSFIGYSIPIAWKKEVWQTFLLFFVMGAGKALGGVAADRFGARRTGVLTTLLCIPFLLFGKDIMEISVFGVFLFSMTMPITFGMCLSLLPEDIGLAFGVTTVGLFIGLIPMFVYGSFSGAVNAVLIVILSLASAYGLFRTLK